MYYAAAEICINSLNPDNFWDKGKCRIVTKWEGLNSVQASIEATFELCAEAFKELVMYQFEKLSHQSSETRQAAFY